VTRRLASDHELEVERLYEPDDDAMRALLRAVLRSDERPAFSAGRVAERKEEPDVAVIERTASPQS